MISHNNKEMLINVGLVIMVCIFILLIFEIVSPFFLHVCVTARNCPYEEYSVETIEYNMSVKLNSHGFRDKEFSNISDDSIAIIGDSFVFGWGIDENKTFVGILEDFFSNGSNPEKNKVLNLGVEGTGLEDYIRRLDKYTGHSKTVVLVFFTVNDIILEEKEKRLMNVVNGVCSSLNSCTLAHKIFYQFKNKNRGSNGLSNSLLKKELDTRSDIDPVLLRLAMEWKINPYTVLSGINKPNLNDYYSDNLKKFEVLEKNKELLNTFIITTKKNNQRLLIVLLPSNFLVSEEYSDMLSKLGHSSTNFNSLVCNTTLHSNIKKFLKDYEVEIIDLQEDMCHSSIAGQFYYNIDGHLTPKGNQFVADIISKQLINENFSHSSFLKSYSHFTGDFSSSLKKE